MSNQNKQLPPNKPFLCEFGHKQVNKCKQGHPIYSHDTRDGWCCACDADIAFAVQELKDEPEFLAIITQSNQALIDEIIEKLPTGGFKTLKFPVGKHSVAYEKGYNQAAQEIKQLLLDIRGKQ